MSKSYKHSYDIPTQVAFWDYDADHYAGGIAWGTQIICGCCGGVFEIEEIIEFAPEDKLPIREFDWIDLSAEIIGGVDPEDFDED